MFFCDFIFFHLLSSLLALVENPFTTMASGPAWRSYAFRCCVFLLRCNCAVVCISAVVQLNNRTKLTESRGISKRTGITLIVCKTPLLQIAKNSVVARLTAHITLPASMVHIFFNCSSCLIHRQTIYSGMMPNTPNEQSMHFQ